MHSLDTGGSRGKNASSSAVPNSPLQSLVQENEMQRNSAQKSYQKSRRGAGNNRDSRDTLEQLIGNSYEKVGDNLLLTSRTRQSYEDQYSGQQQQQQHHHHHHQQQQQHCADERPLTSAGKKNRRTSRGKIAICLYNIIPVMSPAHPCYALLCYAVL